MVSRSELATRLARNGASHAQAAHAVDAVLHEITAALVAGERVSLTGFGTFEPVARPERTARNPRTGEPVQVAAATVARFRAGAGLRGALAGGDAGSAPEGALPERHDASAAVLQGDGATPGVEAAPAAAENPGAVRPAPRTGKKTGKAAKQAKPGKPGKAAVRTKHGKAAKGSAKVTSPSKSAKAASAKKASAAGKKSKSKH